MHQHHLLRHKMRFRCNNLHNENLKNPSIIQMSHLHLQSAPAASSSETGLEELMERLLVAVNKMATCYISFAN
jgi:hypothetical protein